jgi:ketosteroid isomerase-like protein
MLMFRYLIAIFFVFAAAMPAVAQEDPLRIVTAADGEYDKVFDAHDAVSLTALYTDDATVLSPTAKAVTGSKAILEHWQAVLKGNWTAHKFEVVSAQPLSDMTILAIAHWSVDLTDASGKVTPFHGDTAQIFVKTDHGWKIRLVSWNILK